MLEGLESDWTQRMLVRSLYSVSMSRRKGIRAGKI